MAKRLLITGRVQGVYYRASFEQQAVRLGLRGWVRNRSDGAVEALVEGDAAAVAAIIDWSRNGPPAARVDNVVVEEATSDSDSFTILPTQ